MKKINLKEIVLITIFLGLLVFIYTSFQLANKNYLEVSYLNVGQGDATFITTPNNLKILIDGGPDDSVSKVLGQKLFLFDKKIDIVVATHDDLDHIFGLVKILEKYEVKILFTSLPNSKNILMQEIMKIAKEKNIKVVHVDRQSILKTSDNVLIKFLFPTHNMDMADDGNSASVVNQIIFGDVKFLTTGDLGIEGEMYLKKIYGKSLQSQVLKLGHHGSDTSSHPKFLQTVSPQVAIISAGKNNRFGHPHKSVLDLLNHFQIKYLETGKEGTINFQTDGKNIWRD